MLSGIKFVPRDSLQKGGSADSDGSDDNRKRDFKRKKEKRRGKKKDSSDEEFSSSEEEEKISKRRRGIDKRDNRKKKKYSSDDSDEEDETEEANDLVDKTSNEVVRKEMGLEWMLKSASKRERNPLQDEKKEEEVRGEEVSISNRKELNPYLKDDGSGYPDEDKSSRDETFLAPRVIGDGGASWRLKALKRAKEQAAREGRKLEEVVGERWSSLGDLATSVATTRAASSHAHLHAIRGRKAGQSENPDEVPKKHENRDYLRGVSSRQSEMRRPRQESNLSWRRNKGNNSNLSSENKALISEAIAGINKFNDDGSFLEKMRSMQNNATEVAGGSNASRAEDVQNQKDLPDLDPSLEGMSANQVAAEVLKLRMRGKHEEADKLSRQMEAMSKKTKSLASSGVPREESHGQSARHSTRLLPGEKKRREDDSDMHLAKSITQNKKYSAAGNIEDEYDYDGAAPSKKKGKRRVDEGEVAERGILGRQMLTQKERCLFCFENPSRPKHLIVSIANFTYLMLPQWQPVASGHCIILPLQHEAATRNIDNNVWEEIRNFKKCLVRMFAKQEKDVVFLETVIGLSKQRRHCLIECIPIPSHLSNAAPMYFKKAIDEAEDEWAQHDAKKLIPTSGNLRQVIPPNFAYFHVEFGLDRGFVHVIDDEANFNSGFGLNIVRGMLQLPEEDMHRRRQYESLDKQQQAIASFARFWEPFDWTRQLE